MSDTLGLASSSASRSVLFVDDEPRVLQGLERMLRPLRHDWQMTFVGGGIEALAALDHGSYDVLVTDMRMPGMNGAELMEQVLERHPRVIRIALSGDAERDVVVRAVRLAHQYLSKPCDADFLKETLSHALRLRSHLENPTLQSILSRVKGLRSVPALYVQLMAELQGSNPSVAHVARIVADDPGMTAKVLQLINSAYFGLRAYVADPERAVQLLGLETIKALALSVQVFAQFDGTTRHTSPAQVWQHSMRVARIARGVARHIGLDSRGINEAFTAGLLHDVGTLVLIEAIPDYRERLATARADLPGVDTVTAEQQAFGASHAEVGSYLFGLWGLPYGIVEAVGCHHRPREGTATGRGPLTAVHAADALDHAARPDTHTSAPLDDEYLAALGLQDAYPEWQVFATEQTSA